jgi:dipeptide/tripeptide permease
MVDRAVLQATVYLTPLVGAYLADAVMGRFWVILVFSCIYFIVSGSSSSSSKSKSSTEARRAHAFVYMCTVNCQTEGF